ncbi:MAG TPA: serine/threonine-protein kinase [Polyangiaceae bacterium]|nr:serine/threonine-protein kinase [Polyangiaceae bacterium]
MRVAKPTLLQFSDPQPVSSGKAPAASARRANVCSTCDQHFSSDTRFCPFDGQALTLATDWDPSTDPLIGSVIDNRYDVERVVGTGGTGVVYAVRHTSLGKRFALKTLRADLSSDAELATRFIQEARTAASVEHPGLVEITDFGRLPSGQAYFVMEYLEGQSLNEVLRAAGRLPVRRAVAIARQIAEALAAAHQRNIVHRDLKPGNIHVGVSGERVKIIDFGLARVTGSSRLTQAGIVFGTAHYMSPEQALGGPAEPRSDLYSLGVILYEMLTGNVPFEADTHMGVLKMHISTPPERPSQANRELLSLGPLEDVILRCLAKDPVDRYASSAEFLSDLERAARVVDPGGVSAPLGATARDSRRDLVLPVRPLWPKVALVFAGCAVGLGLIIALRLKHEAPKPVASSEPVARPFAVTVATSPAHDEPASPTAQSDPGAPATPEPSAAPASSAPTRAPAASRPKRSPRHGSAKSVGGSEIVYPWKK